MEDILQTVDEIRDEILRFKNDSDVQRLQSLYKTKSFSEILGVTRREISHSGFLAWILNDKESHYLSLFSITRFLEIIIRSSKDRDKEKHKDLFNSVITDDFSIKNSTTESEKSISGVGRLDIYIEIDISFGNKQTKLKIIIENKVESKEKNDQTNAYFNYFEKVKKENEICLYIYLTPLPTIELESLSESESRCKEFIQINYQYLVDYLLEPALEQNISPKTRFIIEEYLQSLSQPILDLETTEFNEGLIMALKAQEKDLLTNFWKKNEKLIRSAIYAIRSNSEDPDERSNMKTLEEYLNTPKDRSTYRLLYKGKLHADNIKKADIGFSTVKLLEKEGLINDDVIKFLQDDKTASFSLIKTLDEVTDTETKYRKYRVTEPPELVYGEKEFYVARNWGKENTQKFMDKFSKRFPELGYEIK
jgi:hypothetical protein